MGVINFLANNYLIFLLISLVLIFALIGYLVESKKKDLDKEDQVENLVNRIDGKSFNDVMESREEKEADIQDIRQSLKK